MPKYLLVFKIDAFTLDVSKESEGLHKETVYSIFFAESNEEALKIAREYVPPEAKKYVSKNPVEGKIGLLERLFALREIPLRSIC